MEINESFDHKQSLKTIDQTKSGLLLNKPDKINRKFKIKRHKLSSRKEYFKINGFMSKNECKQILESAYKYSLSPLDTYDVKERDSKRLCIIDEDLSKLLWRRLEYFFKFFKLRNKIPFGFDVDGKWTPFSVNKCFRINEYTAPSIGFTPHFDSQFCPDVNTRSIFSVVIYLNDKYKGGETILYDFPKGKHIDPYDLTNEQEINKYGGIDKFVRHIILPKTGKCLIFNHDVLHSGNKLLDGKKIIIRTDLVFKRNFFSVPKQLPTIRQKKDYDKCLNLFREAQNKELDGKIDDASRLYERSLSIRRSQSIKKPVNIFPEVIMLEIFKGLTLQDMEQIKLVSKTFKSDYDNYYNILFKKIKPKNELKNETNYGLGYEMIPEFIKRCGTVCVFRYTNCKNYYNEHKIECLRLVTMYSLFLFGHKKDSKTFVAQYDPARQQIFKCSKNWLLICAFYNLPCRGSYFHLYGNPRILTNRDCFFPSEKKQGKNIKTMTYEEANGVLNETKEKLDREEHNIYQDVSDFSTINLKQNDIDNLFRDQNEKKFMDFISTKNCKYSLLSDDIGKKEEYYEELKKLVEKKSLKTCYTNILETVHLEGKYCEFGCDMCNGADHTDYLQGSLKFNMRCNNNLICDFSKNKLQISRLESHEKCDQCKKNGSIYDFYEDFYDSSDDYLDCYLNSDDVSEAWIGKLVGIDSELDFNHASCQGAYYATPTSVDCNIEKNFTSIYFVDHVHLFICQIGDDIIINTKYDGIKAF